jgi:hypothetical protein
MKNKDLRARTRLSRRDLFKFSALGASLALFRPGRNAAAVSWREAAYYERMEADK